MFRDIAGLPELANMLFRLDFFAELGFTSSRMIRFLRAQVRREMQRQASGLGLGTGSERSS